MFLVSVLRYGHPVKRAKIHYQIGPEQMTPVKIDSAVVKNDPLKVEGGTLKKPGFLRCTARVKVDGSDYEGVATAAFSPEKIVPTVPRPADFDAFWKKTLAAARKTPLAPRMQPLPGRSTGKIKAFHVSFANNRKKSRIYGILRVPKRKGKMPALLIVPPAGVRAYTGDMETAAKGIITLEIGIHGVPVNQPDSVYDNLARGALKDYKKRDNHDREKFYFKRVFTGCSRAVDFLLTLPEVDGKRLAVFGGSQGGGLAIVTAALNPKIRFLAVEYPGLCDLTGYFHGRAGGWPAARPGTLEPDKKEGILKTLPYFDAVNFCKRIKAPGFYTLGYNDPVTPPTSIFAALNSIKAPKTVFRVPVAGHFSYPEQIKKVNQWLYKALGR
jgi:cephalosporin-C deacetylase-like acetyl esterase